MRPLPIVGTRVTGIRSDYTIHIYTDGDYEFVLEAPLYIYIEQLVTVVDPTQGKPDEGPLQKMVGHKIEAAAYSDREGLLFAMDDGRVYRVPPIEDFESWQCVGADFYAVGVASNTFRLD